MFSMKPPLPCSKRETSFPMQCCKPPLIIIRRSTLFGLHVLTERISSLPGVSISIAGELCTVRSASYPFTVQLLRFIRFIQFVILVVLRTLQGQLKCEAALRDLVDPYPGGNFSRSRVSSALLACFGRSVRLR